MDWHPWEAEQHWAGPPRQRDSDGAVDELAPIPELSFQRATCIDSSTAIRKREFAATGGVMMADPPAQVGLQQACRPMADETSQV